MARTLYFMLVKREDNTVLEVSELIHDCFDMRNRLKLTRDETYITHDWEVHGGTGT